MKEKKYCVYCGTENKIEKKLCKKCLKSLNPKDHPLLEYFKSKIIGNYQDNLFSIIKGYIRSHLYGFILACSILVTAVTALVNMTNSTTHFEVVTEKPTIFIEKYEYQGTGLNEEELAKKYVYAIKDNDVKAIKGLQLETFYKDIYRELMDKKNTYTDRIADTHELVQNREIYFKSAKENPYIGRSDYAKMTKTFGAYQTNNYIVFLPYCSYNKCEIFHDQIKYDVEIAIEIQIITIEENHYIVGEKISEYLNWAEAVYHRTLFLEHGDLSNVNLFDSLDKFESCRDENGIHIPMLEDTYNEECLKKIGFHDIPVQKH